jgi:hypothetical protein
MTDTERQERIAKLQREIEISIMDRSNMAMLGCPSDELEGVSDYIEELENELKKLQAE